MVYATSKASDQPAHTRSLIRAFVCRLSIMNIKLLTEHHMVFLSLTGGCTGSSQSTLVKMPHCWKCHGSNRLPLPCQSLLCLGLKRSEFPLSAVSCFSRPVSGRILVDKSLKHNNFPFSLVIVCLIFITSQPA